MTVVRRLSAVVVLVSLCFQVVLAGPFDQCQEYIRYGTPSDQGDLLCRTGYALAHNPEHKTPDWVAERLTREKAAATRARSNDFRPDPDLTPGRRAELSDYKNSGYDRGHMAPAGDMRWDPDAMSESFYLSNMSPQIGPGMNRGIWKDLEEKVRTWAIKRGELYIYTGPVYKDTPKKTIGSNQVAVPTHFYKIVFDPVRVEAIAFLLPNKTIKTKDLSRYLVSVNEVEAQTGLDFLSNIDTPIQKLVESKKAGGMWE